MIPGCKTLLQVLVEPGRMADLSLAEWDRLLPQALRASLLSRLALLAGDQGFVDGLPAPVRRHFASAATAAVRQRQAVAWEARMLDQALAAEGVPGVLLKGAAYVMADLPPARGRLFADVDLLVPKAALARVESTLMLHGWVSGHHSAYDQRYYRQWMHELPPMQHIRRKSNLDVHHDLLPETARLKTRPDLILGASAPLPGFASLCVPSLEDLVLHSATHLFHEGEWGHGLRDLADLDALLRHGTARPGWWTGLFARARALNLVDPLVLALRYCHRLLATPVPEETLAILGVERNSLRWLLRDALFLRGFAGAHPGCRLWGNDFAEFLLYVRAHALRMPMNLLLPHLGYKAWHTVRRQEKNTG